LTHDYLVPALRRWLTRKQMETPRGRAELRLAERAALWNAKPENRRLPDWQEYLSILRLTDRESWTGPQRRMMRQAGRYHAQTLVRRLLEAELADVPEIVRQIQPLRKWAEPILRKEQQAAPPQSKAKVHTALALLPADTGQLDYLYGRLLQAASGEFPILRDALAEHKEQLSGRLWPDAESAASEERRLRAAAALAAYDPANPRWQAIRADVAQALTRMSPEFLGDWKEALRPVRAELVGPLGAIFRNHELGELQLALATSALADYAADDARLLADLLMDANPRQFAGLFPVLSHHGEVAVRELEQELEKVVQPSWPDSPPDPTWGDVPAELRHAIEAAGGMLNERVAFCQTMPRVRFGNIVEHLGSCGYRPLCIRPYFKDGLLVAAVWTRDGRPWQWLSEADADQLRTRDADLGREGFVPIDVSAVCPRDGAPPCYTAVWEKAGATDTAVRLVAGRLGAEEQKALAALVEEKFNCQTAQVGVGGQGQPYGGSLWTRRKDKQTSTARHFHGPAAEFREDDCPGLLLTDVRLSQCQGPDDETDSPGLWTTALWNVSTQFESKALHGLSPAEQLVQALRFTAEGFRPVAISASGAVGITEEVRG
jgi:hypothetical protein